MYKYLQNLNYVNLITKYLINTINNDVLTITFFQFGDILINRVLITIIFIVNENQNLNKFKTKSPDFEIKIINQSKQFN